jgi:hypothetical protein
VVVDQFDVPGTAGTPREADAPLVVDADAVLPAAAARELLQAVAWGTRRSLMLSAALMRTSLIYASLLSSGLSFLT